MTCPWPWGFYWPPKPWLKPRGWLKLAGVGEVSLEGSLRSVPGVLSMALMAKAEGFENIVVPAANIHEASLVEGLSVFGLNHINELPVLVVAPPYV